MTDHREFRNSGRSCRVSVLALALVAFALGACEMRAIDFVRSDYSGKSFLEPSGVPQPYFRDEYGNPYPGGTRPWRLPWPNPWHY
jgi:hypothetical protein